MPENINKKSYLRFGFNPYIRYCANNMGERLYTNPVKRAIPIIVSVTLCREHFDYLELSVFSIFNQSVKPDRVILWLSDEYENLSYIPYNITKYIKNGLEIRFIKDLNSYNKIYYPLKEYSDSIIVTAEDNIIYSKDWLEKLYHSYIANSEDIQVHLAKRVSCIDGKISLPKNFGYINEEYASYNNIMETSGGVLYPPKCFVNEFFRKDIFQKYIPREDNIWTWLMAIVSGRKIRIVKNHNKTLACADFLEQLGIIKKKILYPKSVNENSEELLQALFDLYESNIKVKLEN